MGMLGFEEMWQVKHRRTRSGVDADLRPWKSAREAELTPCASAFLEGEEELAKIIIIDADYGFRGAAQLLGWGLDARSEPPRSLG